MNDMVVFTPEQRAAHGGMGPVVIVYKVTDHIHLVDPETAQMAEISGERYWKHPFRAYATQKSTTEAVLLDVEHVETGLPKSATETSMSMDVEMSDVSIKSNPAFYHRRGFRKFAKMDVELALNSEVGQNSSKIYSHLGKLLKPGDSVLCYDLRALTGSGEIPEKSQDMVIVKKIFPQRKENNRRIWKLKRMELEKSKDDAEFDEFMNDLEEDPEMRQKMNLFRNEAVQIEEKKEGEDEDEDYPEVQLHELIDQLNIDS